MKHYDVIIATPGSMITAAFVRSLTKTIKTLENIGITWNFINYESSYIRYAREAVINYGEPDNLDSQVPFLGFFDYDKIMWIDSDISWEPEDFLSLYNSHRDIVCGSYLMLNGRIAASIDGESFLMPNEIPNREVQLSTCGFGFICIKKGVFELLPKPWFDSKIINNDNITTTLVGEDNSWCSKAIDYGFKIWLNPSVKVVHNKMIPLMLPN